MWVRHTGIEGIIKSTYRKDPENDMKKERRGSLHLIYGILLSYLLN